MTTTVPEGADQIRLTISFVRDALSDHGTVSLTTEFHRHGGGVTADVELPGRDDVELRTTKVSQVEIEDACIRRLETATERLRYQIITIDEIDFRRYPRFYLRLQALLPLFTDVTFVGCLDDDLMDELAPALRQSSPTLLSIQGSHQRSLRDRGLAVLAELNATSVEALYNDFTDAGVREYVRLCRRRGVAPVTLDLSRSVRFRDPEALRDLFTLPGLERLEIVDTGVTSQHLEDVIAPALAAASELRSLNILGSVFDKKALRCLSHALRTNESLRYLCIGTGGEPVVPDENCTLIWCGNHQFHHEPVTVRNVAAEKRVRACYAAMVVAVASEGDTWWMPDLYRLIQHEQVRVRKLRWSGLDPESRKRKGGPGN